MSSTKTSMLGRLFGRKNNTVPEGRPTEAAIEAWLVERLATHFEIAPQEIDVHETFSNYGLDSRTAVGLSGELERWLGRLLPPTLVWDFPTIGLMAKNLAETNQAPTGLPESNGAAPSAPTHGRQEL
jgi:acyl carrier protein